MHKKLAVSTQLQTYFQAKHEKGVGTPFARVLPHYTPGRNARVGIYATCIFSCTFMYLCVLCYFDACLKSSVLRVGVKTLHQ